MRVKWSKVVPAIVVVTVLGTTPATARPNLAAGDVVEQHCVVHVESGALEGILETTGEACFASAAEALAYATDGAGTVAQVAEGTLNDAATANGYSFVLGIHYDGYNGTGSSITVVGNSCSGGWWNVPLWFSYRISSSWAGCYQLTHFDHANMGGSSYTTYGSNRLFNLYSFNNRTGSVRYSG